MRFPMKSLFAAFTFLLVLCTSCNRGPTQAPRLKPGQVLRGDEWLSWTPSARNQYVYGYLDGYSTASFDTCEAADDLFAAKLPYRAGDENAVNVPLSRCLERRQKYSKMRLTEDAGVSVSPYPEILTELYEKHPDSRSAPYVLLLGLLSDGHATNVEELYRAQSGQWPNARN
jgi:hypothetical protein